MNATISQITTDNFERATMNTRTARDMAMASHNLSADGKYAREPNGRLWIWSDSRESWVQIDRD